MSRGEGGHDKFVNYPTQLICNFGFVFVNTQVQKPWKGNLIKWNMINVWFWTCRHGQASHISPYIFLSFYQSFLTVFYQLYIYISSWPSQSGSSMSLIPSPSSSRSSTSGIPSLSSSISTEHWGFPIRGLMEKCFSRWMEMQAFIAKKYWLTSFDKQLWIKQSETQPRLLTLASFFLLNL